MNNAAASSSPEPMRAAPVEVARARGAGLPVDLPLAGADGERLPSLRDPWVRVLLVLVFALQAFAWWTTDGYQIADSVEFMERARTFARSERMVDAGAIRPFGFSAGLLPFFALADWLGLEDQRPVSWAICILQMGCGLALVLVCARVGARLAGREGGKLAGFLAGTNPVFLQYSTQPVTGIAAGVCVGMALESLLERGGFRRGLAGGSWLGGAFLMAFQSVLVALPLAALVWLRDRRRGAALPPGLRGVACGFAAALAVQAALDAVLYGKPGLSLWNYLLQNFGLVSASILIRLKQRWLAEPIYRQALGLLGKEYGGTDQVVLGALQSPWFYLLNLPRMIVWPAIAALALAVARFLRRPSWLLALPLGVVAANVAAMSNKGSKDFRLWLPLLPCLAPLCAYGWTAVAGGIGRGSRPGGRLLTAAFVGAALLLSLQAYFSLNTRRFGGYWMAIEHVNALARERAARDPTRDGAPARLRVGSAYNWAVYLRESPQVALVKLPWQLNLWKHYGPEERAADLAAIETLDVLVAHLPVFIGDPELMEAVNRGFEVEAALYDQETYEDGLGPIFVLARRSGRPGARTFFDVAEPGARVEPRATAWPEAHFLHEGADGASERLVLLDWSYRSVPPQDLGWITYRWTAPARLAHDYWILDRITAPEESRTWQNNHLPAYGVHPTSSWAPGSVLSESYLVVPAKDPYGAGGPRLPIGGDYRRGDLIPVRLWMAVIDYDPAELEAGRLVVRAAMEPARPGQDHAILPPEAEGPLETEDGFQFSADRMVRVGSFFLPVQRNARVPDDGRPIED